MSKVLVYTNIILAAALCSTFFYTGARARNHALANKSPSPFLNDAEAINPGPDTAALVKQRIDQKLHADHLSKFLASFEQPDPTMRSNLSFIKEGVYHNYSTLLKKLGLPDEKTERLAELLARRETSTKYFIALPPEIAEAGILTSLSFGAKDIEAQIRAEFGDATLSAITAFDADLPVAREQMEVLEILACTGQPPGRDLVLTLSETLKSNPPPKKPINSASESEVTEYHRNRLARVDKILDSVSATLDGNAKDLLQAYLLEKEEASLDLATLKNAGNAPRTNE